MKMITRYASYYFASVSSGYGGDCASGDDDDDCSVALSHALADALADAVVVAVVFFSAIFIGVFGGWSACWSERPEDGCGFTADAISADAGGAASWGQHSRSRCD